MRIACLCAALCVSVPPTAAQEAIGEVFSTSATVRGAMVLTGSGTRLLSGSSVTAAGEAALVRLERGGEVRVCPRTTVSVTASKSGRDLLWALSQGALELHFDLAASADNVMTPDFRMMLSGPGSFHFAIRADDRGRTCVRSLPRNTAALIVYEQFGDGTFQVKPGEQVVFRNGRVADPETAAADCGCPPAPEPVKTAEAAVPAQPSAKAASEAHASASPEAKRAEAAPPAPDPKALEWKPGSLTPPEAAWSPPVAKSDVTAPPPPAVPGEIRVQIDAPFVFRATDIVPAPPQRVARADLRSLPEAPVPLPELRPPPAPAAQAAESSPAVKKKKRGFFGAIGAFFSALFGGGRG
ncbi:MAG TPA: hypothetical protein VNK82_00985 [Terriglobales bacterium]|nr:hypothetical protein [Terriglobales bacterium]